MKRLLLTTALILGIAGAPATADAAEITFEGDTLVYRAAPGEENFVVMSSGYAINDTRAPISAPSDRCWSSVGGIYCDGAERFRFELGDGPDSIYFATDSATARPVEVLGGDGDDDLRVPNQTPDTLTLDGGPGKDQVEGNDKSQTLRGGPGDDDVAGRGGDDALEGGDGNDKLSPDGQSSPGNDRVDGGPGWDSVSDWAIGSGSGQPPANVSLDGQANDGRPGESDNVTGVEDFTAQVSGRSELTDADEVVWMWANLDGGASTINARGGNDDIKGEQRSETIDGGAGNDRLEGGYGNDAIVGGPGSDEVYGDDTDGNCGLLVTCNVPQGNDTIDVRDGEADTVDCGVGEDSVKADGADTIAPSCEHVDKQNVGPGNVGPGSDGPQPNGAACVVPKVKNLAEKKAKSRLKKAGCKSKVKRARHKKVKRGRVIKASAKPGTRLAAGTKVTLTVSRGRR